MRKMCESCGMPLKKDEIKGTKADGSKSERYCKLCYENGQFKTPDITVEQMKELAKNGMHEQGWPMFLAAFFTKNIPNLPRWQQEDSSKPVE